MSFKTNNTVESQVTSHSMMDSSTRNIILGAVFGGLAAVVVLAIIYYYCSKKNKTNKDKEEVLAVSPLPERVSADTFTKNLGATQTVLDMGFLSSQDSVTSVDYQESKVTTTPDMFKNSPITLENSKKCGTETSVHPEDINSKEMSPVTCSVSALGVQIPERVEQEKSFDSVKVDIPESTDLVFKQPKQNSMSHSVLSFLRRNQVDGSLTTDTYFQSSFSNIKILEESNSVKDDDELTSSSERLKNLLEKDDDELEVVKDEGKKGGYTISDNISSDSVFLPGTVDPTLGKGLCKNDSYTAALLSPVQFASVQSVSELLSPCTVDTCGSVQSVTELLSDNQTSSSSFSFKALAESPEEVNKELDWDSSHEPLETRTSVLKLVCTPNPCKTKWADASSSSNESPQKLQCVLETPRDEEWDDEAQGELEWDDENQHGTNVTSSFHITLSNLQIGEKSSQTPRKSCNSSFSSAMSTGRTPLHSRLRNSCAGYETAEEDI